MSNTPVIKVTLQHIAGTLSTFKPGSKAHDAQGGIREAIITCSAPNGGAMTRVDLLRADLAGADWAHVERAGAVADLYMALKGAASDLLDGHDPHVVVTLDPMTRAMTNARLVTNKAKLAEELASPSNRSVVVPRLLPYQIGGSAEGATALMYIPKAGGGMRMHSMHPTAGEAQLAQSHLTAEGEDKTALMPVQTPVTSIISAIVRNTFKATAVLADVLEHVAHSSRQPSPELSMKPRSPGMIPTPYSPPSPFHAN